MYWITWGLNDMDTGKKKKNAVMRQVFAECAVSMWIPVLFQMFVEMADSILGVVTADTLGEFADAAFALELGAGIHNIILLVLCMAAVVFASPALELLGNFIMLERSLKHDNLVAGHYLDQEPEAAKAREGGEAQYQLEDEPLTLRIQWVRICSKALALPVCTACLLYCAGSVNRLLTVLMFALAGVRLVTPVALKNRLAAFDRAEQVYYAKRRSYEKDIVSNCLSVRLLGIRKAMLERLQQLFESYYRETDAERIVWQTLAERSEEFADRLTQLLLVAAGAVMTAAGYITAGGLASMLVYYSVVQSLLGSLGEIIRNYPLMRNAAAVVEGFYQDREEVSGIAAAHLGDIRGEGISLGIAGQEVLHPVDFSIAVGEKTGICGDNGSGKSTLGRILASLIKKYGGTITVGNTAYRSINPENWRFLLAYVPQNPWLFRTTVRENIMMGNFDADPKLAERLMRDFGILSIADKMLSEESGLSGGERTKVSIVRGLLRESELLILDEPTNNLDHQSVLALKKYLMETKQTVILISHDSALLNEMDRCIRCG